MNARQKKKYLKKRIKHLESDNNLMRRIIADNPGMQELYDLYNKPFKNKCTTIPFQEFRAKRAIPKSMTSNRGIIDHTKLAVAKDLFKGIKENIIYEINNEDELISITGSIFIGRKRGKRMTLNEAFDDVIEELEQKYKPKTGHWIYTLEDWNKWECSECGFTKRTDVHVSIGYKYCPNCGTKMESEVKK